MMTLAQKMPRLERYFARTKENERQAAVIAYLASLDHIAESSPSIAKHITDELKSQRTHLKLIASENYSSLAVQLAMGNLLTDKYAEGVVNHRFYAGCEHIDAIEAEGIEEIKKLFSCDHAYIQPHSGADANLVAFWTILVHRIQNKELESLGKKTIDELSNEEYERIRQLMTSQTMMGLSLNSGGHLTHGYRHNVSGKMFRSVPYHVNPSTGLLDYTALAEQVKEVRPAILLAGYSAHSRKLNFATLREIADSVDAVLMTDMAHFAGLVAGKVFTGDYDPVPFSQIVTTTTHKTLRGPRGGAVLCSKEYTETLNKGCPLVLGGPLPHVMAAKTIAFKEANQPSFKNYAQQIVNNAQALAEGLKNRGHLLVSGGTDNHLVLLDISNLPITGRQAEMALKEAKLTANRNAIPQDKNGPWYTSGIRLGTAALTSLGMGTKEMDQIAQLISTILTNTQATTVATTGQPSKAKYRLDQEILEGVQQSAQGLLDEYKLYPELDIDYS